MLRQEQITIRYQEEKEVRARKEMKIQGSIM
uniref:Uncharacterized protein n=1 Tax=Rhizophora mucronata TaxID=61149 RepID=A0A2P2MZJ8_RHIMU